MAEGAEELCMIQRGPRRGHWVGCWRTHDDCALAAALVVLRCLAQPTDRERHLLETISLTVEHHGDAVACRREAACHGVRFAREVLAAHPAVNLERDVDQLESGDDH